MSADKDSMSTGENNTSAGPNDPNQGSTLYFDPSTDEKAMATLRELELAGKVKDGIWVQEQQPLPEVLNVASNRSIPGTPTDDAACGPSSDLRMASKQETDRSMDISNSTTPTPSDRPTRTAFLGRGRGKVRNANTHRASAENSQSVASAEDTLVLSEHDQDIANGMKRVINQFNIDFEEQRAAEAAEERARIAAAPIRSYFVTDPIPSPVMIHVIDSVTGESHEVSAVEIAREQQAKIRKQAQDLEELEGKVRRLQTKADEDEATIVQLREQVKAGMEEVRQVRAELAMAGNGIKAARDLISTLQDGVEEPIASSSTDSDSTCSKAKHDQETHNA